VIRVTAVERLQPVPPQPSGFLRPVPQLDRPLPQVVVSGEIHGNERVVSVCCSGTSIRVVEVLLCRPVLQRVSPYGRKCSVSVCNVCPRAPPRRSSLLSCWCGQACVPSRTRLRTAPTSRTSFTFLTRRSPGWHSWPPRETPLCFLPRTAKDTPATAAWMKVWHGYGYIYIYVSMCMCVHGLCC
jgi:hypothetical protein